MSKLNARKFNLRYDNEYQYLDGVRAEIIVAKALGADIGENEIVQVIEAEPVLKRIEMLEEIISNQPYNEKQFIKYRDAAERLEIEVGFLRAKLYGTKE